MRPALAAVLCVIALTACQKKVEPAAPAPVAAAAPTGFQHEAGFDAQGIYRPAEPAGAGPMKLTAIAVGAPSDFEAWEGGKREEVFGPILLTFEDLNSPLEDAEKGQRHKVRVEVKPTAYRLTPGQFAFRGHDAQLGDIGFDGAFDTAALAQAKAGQGDGKPVLSGSLTSGGQTLTGVKLSPQSGD
jgi:hypothetical protein